MNALPSILLKASLTLASICCIGSIAHASSFIASGLYRGTGAGQAYIYTPCEGSIIRVEGLTVSLFGPSTDSVRNTWKFFQAGDYDHSTERYDIYQRSEVRRKGFRLEKKDGERGQMTWFNSNSRRWEIITLTRTQTGFQLEVRDRSLQPYQTNCTYQFAEAL